MLARTHGFKHKAAAAGLVFVGGTSAGGNGDAYTSVSLTSLTGGIASAPAAGDIVIVCHGWSSTSDGDPTISGYTELTELYANDQEDANMVVAYKVMGGTPDTSITVPNTGTTSDGLSTAVHVWRNINATPIDVTTTTATGTNTDVADAPSITPTTAGAIVLACGLAANDAGEAALTVPSGYGNFFGTRGGSSSRQAQACIASKAWTSGAENPPAFGGGSGTTDSSWAAATVALRPA